MTMTVNITDFRKNIFKYTDLMLNGYEFEVERAGRKVFKTSRPDIDDVRARGERLYKLLKKVGGKFPDWKYSRALFRDNKAEREYAKRMENLWK